MKFVISGFVLACLVLLLPQALPPVVAQDDAARVQMRVIARVTAGDEKVSLKTLSDGDPLGAGDEVQIRVEVSRDAYVYVVAYNAATRSALLLHPTSGRAEDALLRSGEERIVPEPERFLSLRREAGIETFYALASESAPQSLASLLVRMEAAGEDERVVMNTIRQKFFNVAALRIRNFGNQPTAAAGAVQQATALAAGIADPQLDVEAMECLYAWLIGKDSEDGSNSALAQSAASGGCPPVMALAAEPESPDENTAPQPSAENDTASAQAPGAGVAASAAPAMVPDVSAAFPSNALADGADDENDPLESPPSAAVPSAPAAAPQLTQTAPAATVLAPPRGDLMLALAREPKQSEPIRSIDVTAEGNVSSSVVLVVTPSGTGTGVVVDYSGHVLANWHIVRGYPSVSIGFKTPLGASPSAKRIRTARVVRISKTADLALLRIDDPPSGITPVRMARTNEIRNGDVVHTVGHPGGGNWTYTLGKIEQVKPGSSWYAGHHLLHRGTVIFAELPDDPGGAGAPLFNNRLELVGIGAMPRSIRGLLTGVSAETIRQFLRAPPAEARASASG